jgi:hypothetical protein
VSQVRRFVERTTQASGVPLQVEDPRVIASIVALVLTAAQPAIEKPAKRKKEVAA